MRVVVMMITSTMAMIVTRKMLSAPGSLEHCWSHPRSSPQIYFLEESKYCWHQPTLLWVVLVVTKANTSDKRTNPDWGGIDRGRWWSALSGRGSWRRICSILRLDLLPSANSDFFAQISLSTCSWVSRSHEFFFVIIFALDAHKVWDLRANKLDPTRAGGESAMLNAASAGFAHSPDWICAQLPIWISPPTVTRPPFLFVCLPAVCRVVNLLLVSCLRNQIRLMRRSHLV